MRIAATSICGTDLHIHEWDPWAQERIRVPMTFGHEVAGHVDAVGAEVRTLSPGAWFGAGSAAVRTIC